MLDNARDFRAGITRAGSTIKDGFHLIVPITSGDAKLAKRAAEELLCAGIYVIAFSYPVVPKGEARIRVQLSAAHSPADVEFAVKSQLFSAWEETWGSPSKPFPAFSRARVTTSSSAGVVN